MHAHAHTLDGRLYTTWAGVCQRPAANGLTASTAGAQITRRLQFATRRSKKLIATHVKRCQQRKKREENMNNFDSCTYVRADMQIPDPQPQPQSQP